MAGFVGKIMPREARYFDLFERHAAILAETAEVLARLLAGEGIAANLDRIRQLETQADEITREVLIAVRGSFITPFDRSAIASLISAMDDAVDEMWHTAKTARIYRVQRFEPQMHAAADLARRAAQLVQEAIPLMRSIGPNAVRLHEITEAIVHLEGCADALHDDGVAAIYDRDAFERPAIFFAGHELFRYIERVLDRLQDVADEIQGIVIDHA